MRLLHTSDWHIGVSTRGSSRLGDQARVLEQLQEIAVDFRPHLILHSGDVFHQPRPKVEELELAWEGLLRLAELAPVVVLAGNHDGPQLFEFFASMRPAGGRVLWLGQPRPHQVLRFPADSGETIRLAALPFVAAHQLLQGEEAPSTRLLTYASRMMRIQKQCAQALRQGASAQRDVLVFAGHLFVEGARLSSSERALHVTDTYAVKPSSLPQVDYLALGHIHFPQDLPGGAPGRYAGSLIPLDFGEAQDRKEVVLVECRPGERAQLQSCPLDRGRPLRVLEGTRSQLERQAPQVGECLLRLKVQVGGGFRDPGLNDWARRLFPRAEIVDILEVRPQAPGQPEPPVWLEVGEAGSLSDAFARYLADVGAEDDVLAIVRRLEEGPVELEEIERLAAEVGLS